MRVQSWDICISAVDYGTCKLCGHETIGRSWNEGTGMVAIESKHKKRSCSMFLGICEPLYNGL